MPDKMVVPRLLVFSFQEWLSRETDCANFSTTASLGVIHRGHLHQAKF